MAFDESAYIGVIIYLYYRIGILFFYFGVAYTLYIIFRTKHIIVKYLTIYIKINNYIIKDRKTSLKTVGSCATPIL